MGGGGGQNSFSLSALAPFGAEANLQVLQVWAVLVQSALPSAQGECQAKLPQAFRKA